MALPNIVLTFADDQRYSMLGSFPGVTADAVRTPSLDAMAQRGACFTHAYHAGSPVGAVCIASRAMLYTGRGPFDMPHNMVRAARRGYFGPDESVTLGQLLQEQGYQTHLIGKWHNSESSLYRSFATGDAVARCDVTGLHDHFLTPLSRWDAANRSNYKMLYAHTTDIFSEAARKWLKQYAQQDGAHPFLLAVAFTAPHDPRRTHKQWHDRYPPEQIAPPPNFMREHPFDNGHLDVRDELLIPIERDEGQVCQELSDYYAMTEHMDYGIGRIHQMLDELGLSDNTLVVHSADHGLAVGQHGLMGKQNMYDASVRVPLLIAGPGVRAGQMLDGLCYQHDLFATLLEAGGADIPGTTAFRSLWPMLRGEKERNYDLIGSYYQGWQRMVTDGHSKFIRYHVNEQVFDQCFDLDTDPWERIDERGMPLSASSTLSETDLENWQRQMGDPLLA